MNVSTSLIQTKFIISVARNTMRVWALLNLVLLVGHLMLMHIPDSVKFSVWDYIYLFAKESILLFFILSLLRISIGFFSNRIHHSRIQQLIKWFDFLILLLIFLFYVSSWIHFRLFGAFLGTESLRMFLLTPRQIAEHANSLAFVQISLGLAAVVCLTFLAVFLLCSKHSALRIVDASAAVVLAILVSFNIIFSLTLNNQNPLYAKLPLYSGPLSYIVWEPFSWSASKYRTQPTQNLHFHHSPLISLNEYSNGIEKEKFKRHNVLLIVVESLRPDAFTTLGGKQKIMPFVEDFSKRGVTFTKAYSQSSHSNYADVSIVSGQYPLRSTHPYYYPKHIPFHRAMLQDILKPLGYKTAIFSSQNEQWGGMLNYINTGNFDRIVHAGNLKNHLRPEHDIYGTLDEEWKDYRKNFNRFQHSGKVDDQTTIDLAIEWLEQNKNANFYVYLNMQSSHAPYYVPIGFPRQFFSGDRKALDYLEKGNLMQLTVGEMESAYWDSLHYIDYQINRLLSYLQENNLLDNTIVVVTGDTATSFHTNIADEKTSSSRLILGNGGELLEEVLHVPLFIVAPGLRKGIRSYTVQHIDIMPAIFNLLGLPLHPALQGRNALNPPKERQQEFAFQVAQTPAANQIAITYDTWRLVLDKMSGELEVYYLQNATSDLTKFKRVEAELLENLLFWERIQLSHYNDPKMIKTFYPPVISN
jgi:arylsulfatase A-like enzyme